MRLEAVEMWQLKSVCKARSVYENRKSVHDTTAEIYVQKQYEIVSEEDCHMTWRGVILHPDAVTGAALRRMNLRPEYSNEISS